MGIYTLMVDFFTPETSIDLRESINFSPAGWNKKTVSDYLPDGFFSYFV